MFIEIILLCILIYILFKMDQKPKDLPPGLWGLPVVGDLSTGGMVTVAKQRELADKYGDIFTVRVGALTSVFLADFDTIKQALNHPDLQGRPPIYPIKVLSFFKNVGLVESEGRTWIDNRRHALFHLKDLGLGKSRMQVPIMKEIEELVSFYEKQDGRPIEVGWELNMAVLNIIWQLVANKRFQIDDARMQVFLQLLDDVFRLMQGPPVILTAFPALEKLPKSIIHKIFKVDLLYEKREQIFKFINENIEEHIANFDPDNPVDYIDYCLLRKKEESDSQSKDYDLNMAVSIFDLFGAGSETSSTSIRWLILFMATNPEVQRKAHAELDLVVPRSRAPTIEDKPQLPFLEAVVMETMRFSSFVSQGVPHAATRDTKLGRFTIPKGTAIIQCLALCHFNPEYFENPTEFNPLRFIGDNGEVLTKKRGYAPFAIGKRQCLGESLAKTEIFLFATSLLQNFEMKVHADHPIAQDYHLSATLFNFPNPFKICFVKRK